jgi:hypothetical protein
MSVVLPSGQMPRPPLERMVPKYSLWRVILCWHARVMHRRRKISAMP